MIRMRTYQDLDPNTAEAERYLARLSAGTVAMMFLAATPLDAQAKAQAWLDRERSSAASSGRLGRTRRAAIQKASPQ